MKDRKINLVVFTREYPTGMAGTKRIQNFLDYLLLQKIIINVLSFRSLIRQPAVRGVHNSVPYLNIGAGITMELSQIHRIVAYYLMGIHAIIKCKKKGYVNIVYNSGGINIENFLFILLAKIVGYKLILAIEEDYGFFNDKIKKISRFKFWTVKKLDFLNCRWSDAIIVISTYLRDKYQRMRAKNVILIPVTAKLNHDKDKRSFNSPLQVIYAGTFTDKDGVSDIIEGFLAFNKKYGNALLIMTGKSAQQQLYKHKYKNEKSIIFRGFIDHNEFYSLLRNADVLCMCRTKSGFANAGFPFKLGEYLATGNPVICTRVSDVKYYLDDEDAFMIDPESPLQICEALSEITKNPDMAKKKGLNGLEKCRKYFSPETNGQILLEYLLKV